MEALLARVSQLKDIEDVDTLWETLEDKNEAALESLSKKVGSLVKKTSKSKAHDETFEEEGEDDEGEDFDDEMDEEDFGEEDDVEGSGLDEGQDDDEEEEEDNDEDIDYNSIVDDSDFDNLDPKEQLRLLNKKVKDDKTLYDEDELEEDQRFKDSDDEEEEEMEEFTPENKKLLNLSDDDEEADELPDLPKSNFERQQDKLKRTIAALESENVGDKNWTLRGEITAKQRPSNSLLEEDLEFEHMTKAAPVITEEVTESLEDIIKKRIRDRAWDNVEPKFLEKTEAARKRPTLELNDAKSKHSLAQVYESEFEKKRKEEQEAAIRKGDSSKDEEAHLDEATKAAHESIKKLFGKICTTLDILSENKFSPRTYAMADVEIKTIKK
jgi:U3 small nucleolar RNA-associated protein MPP10